MQIRTNDGQVMYESEFRTHIKANGGPSWDTTTTEVLESLGASAVFEGPQASEGTRYQFSVYGGIEQIDGKWFTKWNLGPSFFDTEDAKGNVTTAAQNEAAYKATKDAEQAKSVRDERTKKLAETDWTQVADAPVDRAVWATYRQGLRDVTAQETFPWDTVWPTKPTTAG
jgi:hypothetical protein